MSHPGDPAEVRALGCERLQQILYNSLVSGMERFCEDLLALGREQSPVTIGVHSGGGV